MTQFRRPGVLHGIFAAAFILSVFITACASPVPEATEPPLTDTPTEAPRPSPSSEPTSQPAPRPSPNETHEPTVQPLPSPTEEPGVQFAHLASPLPVSSEGFASYEPVPISPPTTHSGYSLPLDLNSVSIDKRFVFSQTQQDLLAANGFVVAPAEYREFFQLYDEARYQEVPTFITTDSVFHVYHLLFDKVLRTLEEERFYVDLEKLTAGMLWAAESQYETLKGTTLEEAALRNLGYFAVARQLLQPGSQVPQAVEENVEAELALIEAHQGFVLSPILGYPEDYSQYVPRGHYNKNEARRRYFKTMMWFGRINFRLKEADETRSALLIAQALANTQIDGEPASQLWERIYEPTAFLVGVSDDVDIYDYHPLIEEVYGSLGNDPTIFLPEEKLIQFVDAAKQLPPPQINSMWVYVWEDRDEATQGFRFMGQRFVIDAYIFQQMIFRNVGTIDDPRMLPKGLDIFSAMGSQEASNILQEMDETHYLNFNEQMSKVQGEIAALQVDSWTQNLYWAWLYSFQPLVEVKGQSYPAFMRTQAWTRKDLHTALGSWTELKHDTILYAKQAYAELGGVFEEPEVKGYVEPNPEAFARLAALTRMTIDGLEARGLLDGSEAAWENRDNLQRLELLLTHLTSIAEKELAGTALTPDEQDVILYYGGLLEVLTIAAADKDEVEGRAFLEDEEAAVIADVATDPMGTVLEEGVGRIFEIYVVVEIEGQPILTKGGVFSYYEFSWPMSDRLTDEVWREMLGAGEVPDRPFWTASFIAE
jgi:hypothetical protein